MAYTDKTNVENYLGITLPSALNTQITNWISAIKEWIDAYCNTTFESGSETRYYDGSGTTILLVDAFTGTPTVITLDTDGDDDITISSGYLDLYPLNKTIKNTIHLKAGNEIGIFPDFKKSVKITATFGSSAAVPELVKLAATRMLAKILENRLKGGTKITSESLGDYSHSYGEIDEAAEILGIKNILDQYKIYNL